MDDSEKYKYKGKLDIVDCSLAENPETFKEVTLEELRSFEDCYLVCTSNDNIFQYYFIKTGEGTNDGFFVKIKYDVVLHYLDEKDKFRKK